MLCASRFGCDFVVFITIFKGRDVVLMLGQEVKEKMGKMTQVSVCLATCSSVSAVWVWAGVTVSESQTDKTDRLVRRRGGRGLR